MGDPEAIRHPEMTQSLSGVHIEHISNLCELGGRPLTAELWLSNVAVAIVLSEKGRAPSATTARQASADDFRAKVGYLMRTAMAYSEQLGMRVPCYCVLRTESQSELGRLAREAAHDQDWHQGTFALIPLACGPDQLRPEVERLLSDVKRESFPAVLARIGAKEVADRLVEQLLAGAAVSNLHGELLFVIRDIVRDSLPPGKRLMDWVAEATRDMEDSQREGAEHGKPHT